MTTLRAAEERPVQQLAAGIAIGIAIVVGLGMIFLAMAFGSCDAMGGTCHGERPSLLEDDVFGMAAFGTALIVAVPIFLSHPSKRRFVMAVGLGLIAAFLVGMAASEAARAG
jgi:F0F1-type ATP synthase membrane subunit c/vacuolar-type H+-ATPase subunit K